MHAPRIDVIYGTPDAALLAAPLVRELEERVRVATGIVLVGGASHAVELVHTAFGHATEITALSAADSRSPGAVYDALVALYREDPPDAVVICGEADTETVAALACAHADTLVVNLGAGRRSTGPIVDGGADLNRRVIAAATRLHLAPTQSAERNLAADGVPSGDIALVGDTGIDAIRQLRGRHRPIGDATLDDIAEGWRRLVLVTCDTASDEIDRHVVDAVQERPDTIAVFASDAAALREHEHGRAERVVRRPSLGRTDVVRLLSRAHVVITDRSTVRADAAALRVPALVWARSDAVDDAGARVCHDAGLLSAELRSLLDDPEAHAALRHPEEITDGFAAVRAADAIERLLGTSPDGPGA